MNSADAPLVVLTGAGISAESGIPTFRGAEGLWQGHDARALATPEAFLKDPVLVWQFYEWRRGLAADHQPNEAHRLLSEIALSLPMVIITQNVDGYHTLAGSQGVLELHGSLWRVKCSRCPKRWEDRQHPLHKIPPLCPSCGELARPDVVWFGEVLDGEILQSAINLATQARFFLSIGTSSVVYPAAELPLIAKRHGAYTVELNPAETPISGQMDEVIRGAATIELRRWWERNKQELLDVE